jgi:RNA polymerase sigma-70 factor (ECF subfamily)
VFIGEAGYENQMSSLPDDLLMLAVRNGDVCKLGLLFERHQGPLFNFYLRMTGNREASEDLVQEVFFRILRLRHTYRGGGQFTTWMYRIARNARIDGLRKRRWEVALDEGAEQSAPDRGPSPVEAIESKQEAALVRQALARLPEQKRELLVLSRFQGLRYDQIAELLGCEPGTLKVRIHRALQALREIFFELTGEKAS